MTTLDELEARLQSLVEVDLLEYLPAIKAGDRIPRLMAEVMHANLKNQPDGSALAPNVYTIVAHPSTLAEWRSKPKLLEELPKALHTAGSEAGLKFSAHPTVTTAADTNMTPGEVRVLASFSEESLGETQNMPANPAPEVSPDTIPSNAFLILEGTKIVPLTHTVVNIGRRLDNHIVIDDPRVSRNHAQLRAIKERFVLFDLNSTGGTYVNGQRSNQTILYPGDVISLAGVTLIFGQDIPPVRADIVDQSTAASPASSDRPTVVFAKPEDKPEE